jgi:predicted nucleotidyltransferase
LTQPAFDQLLRRLSEAGVDFVLIGGLAVNAWGVIRGTKDLDIVVAPDSENLKKLATVAVVQGLDGVPSYAELRPSAVEADILGVKVAVCSIDALKRMKQVAGRPRDQVDLEDLDATAD